MLVILPKLAALPARFRLSRPGWLGGVVYGGSRGRGVHSKHTIIIEEHRLARETNEFDDHYLAYFVGKWSSHRFATLLLT